MALLSESAIEIPEAQQPGFQDLILLPSQSIHITSRSKSPIILTTNLFGMQV